jgi:hypothetical protein
MEHRWGNRIPVDIGVRISARPGMIDVGRILDLSVSGAWIRAHLNLSVLARVTIVIDSTPARKHEAPLIGAYVTRTSREGFGVAWYELDPPLFSELLHPHAFHRNAGTEVTEYPNTPTLGTGLLMAELSSVVEFFEPPSRDSRGRRARWSLTAPLFLMLSAARLRSCSTLHLDEATPITGTVRAPRFTIA